MADIDEITTDGLRAAIDAALADHLARVRPRLAGLHPSLEPLADELESFVLGGGKRVRPTLLLLGHRAGGGRDPADAMGPALALELLHTCALLHDDIIDAAPTRRGRPSTHRRFAALHREAGWTGDPTSYGEAAALLLGDLAFVLADELFLEATVDPSRLLAAFRRFTVLREEVMAGQYVDVHTTRTRATSRELALTVASLKSGRYSVARPLEIGALLAGADDELVSGLGRVGEPLGRAFQVRDDILGVFGEEAETGKSVASDLAEGKRTLLVAETLDRLEGQEAERFNRRLGDPSLTPEDAGWLRATMESSGGLAAAQRYVDETVGHALGALADLDVPPDAAAALEAMARFIGDRTA